MNLKGIDLLTKLYNLLRGLFNRKPVRLAIVRRYCDANGSYVGELYLEQTQGGISSYRMIGASLDTLPFIWDTVHRISAGDYLDTDNDFLQPMPRGTIRVGALEPYDNDRVRKMVAKLPRHRITLAIQNRFIEYVLDRKV